MMNIEGSKKMIWLRSDFLSKNCNESLMQTPTQCFVLLTSSSSFWGSAKSEMKWNDVNDMIKYLHWTYREGAVVCEWQIRIQIEQTL